MNPISRKAGAVGNFMAFQNNRLARGGKVPVRSNLQVAVGEAGVV
jgi:hypothetical protein